MANNLKTRRKQAPKKQDAKLYAVITFVILCFGYIVAKDVALPQMVTWPIMFLGLLLILFSAFRSPRIPFYILLIYMPFNNVLVGKLSSEVTGINLTNVLTLIVLFSWITYAITHKNERLLVKSTLNFPLTLFCFLGLVSLLHASTSYGYAYNFAEYVILFKRWISPMLLYFIALNVVKDKETFKRALFLILLVTMVIGLMAIREYMHYEEERVAGVFLQPNMLGAYFSYTMFFFAGFFLYYYRSLKYWLMLIPFLICFRGIMVSFSRGAYIASAFGGLMTTFFRSKLLFAFTLAVLAFAVLNPVFMPGGIRYRMATTFGGDEVFATDIEDVTDLSATKRIDIWKGAVEMIKERPLTGFGYGTFPMLIGNYAPASIGRDAHNTYLIIAAEMGIPELLLFLLILFIAAKNAHWLLRRCKDRFFKAYAIGFLGGIFALIVVNMFGSRLNSEDVSSYFWVLVGLTMRAVIMKRKGEIE